MHDRNKTVFGLSRLWRLVQEGGDLARVVAQAAEEPDNAVMLMQMSFVLQITGQREAGLALQARALQLQRHFSIPARHEPVMVRVLVLLRAGDMMDNTPIDFLLEDSDISMEYLYLSEFVTELADCPAHDLVFVAVGESTANRPMLERLGHALQNWPSPVFNLPQKICGLARHTLFRALDGITGVYIPPTLLAGRELLSQITRDESGSGEFGCGESVLRTYLADAQFPLIVRPLDSHAGHGLARVMDRHELRDYLQTQVADMFYLAPFVDYASPDGVYRKYRLALLAGKPFACHMAIGEQWMLHYKDAGMAESAVKRAEEACFMTDFASDFGLRHAQALTTIAAKTGLDYVVMDCAELPDGRLLVFEMDNRGFVHALDPVGTFPYKAPVMQRLFAAFRLALGRKAGKIV